MMIQQIMSSYGDASYLADISWCLGLIPAGFILGVIAWAFGYVVVFFLQTVKKAV